MLGSRLLHDSCEVNQRKLIGLSETENNGGNEHGASESQTIMRQPEPARWRKELIDKPKSATEIGCGKPLLELEWSERASLRVNIDEASKDEVPELAVTQKRWHVTGALANERGQTVGCPRHSSEIGIHRVDCRQSCMRQTHEQKTRGPTTRHTGSSGIRCSEKRRHQISGDAIH